MKSFLLKVAMLAVLVVLAIAVQTRLGKAAALTPVLGNYPNASLPLSTDTMDTPDAPPMNTTRINVSASTNFEGTLEGNPATGVVRVTDAHPAGTYTVTVRAFGSDGTSATKTFTVTVTTPATCNPISFAPAIPYGAGIFPDSVAVGDFNGDGNQDIVALNDYEPGTVSIFLGHGDGSFSAATNFGVNGSDPRSVAVGDFNGDGNQDLVVANYNSSTVSILLGDGAGNFPTATSISVGYPSVPTSVAVGDFNGDGKQDLAVIDSYGHVSILLGHGDGTFGARTDFAIGSSPWVVAVGDFNGDGNQDLAVLSPGGFGTVSILLGNGAGGFSAPTNFSAGSISWAVAVGNFNGGGNQDLAVVNEWTNNVSILLGDGTGNFSGPTNFATGSGPFSVAVGDFNGDGNQDIVVLNGGNASILVGDGMGNFSAPTNFGAGISPSAVAVGDFNGDGKQDLAVAHTGNPGSISILLRDCALTPTSIVSRIRHGSAGTFDIILPLTGSPGIECRTTGGTNDYTIIVTFPGAVTVNGSPQAGVTLGTGCVGTAGTCSGSVNISGNTVTIPLTNVTNVQIINVTLFQVNGESNLAIPMGVLAGDVSGNGAVNASDVAFTKGHLGQPLDATNFRSDVNANGVINAVDVSLVKIHSGDTLPPQ